MMTDFPKSFSADRRSEEAQRKRAARQPGFKALYFLPGLGTSVIAADWHANEQKVWLAFKGGSICCGARLHMTNQMDIHSSMLQAFECRWCPARFDLLGIFVCSGLSCSLTRQMSDIFWVPEASIVIVFGAAASGNSGWQLLAPDN